MNNAPTHNNSSCVFFNQAGYLEMVFSGIVGASELRRLMAETNRLAEIHGPTGLLLDGRNGRISYDAGTIMAFSEAKMTARLTHMIILTHTSNYHRNAILKNPQGIVSQVSAQVFGVPQTYLSDEIEARRQVTIGNHVARS